MFYAHILLTVDLLVGETSATLLLLNLRLNIVFRLMALLSGIVNFHLPDLCPLLSFAFPLLAFQLGFGNLSSE